MKFISSMYMPRRNFWCMTRGDSSHLNFQLQKVDWGPSGRQNWRKTMEFWKILYITFIREPKGITYVAFFLQIESHRTFTTNFVLLITTQILFSSSILYLNKSSSHSDLTLVVRPYFRHVQVYIKYDHLLWPFNYAYLHWLIRRENFLKDCKGWIW